MRCITGKAQKRLDALAEELGIPGLILMERAGRAVAERIIRLRPSPCEVCVLCGGGNNGGDGFAAAAILLSKNYSVSIFTQEKYLQNKQKPGRNNDLKDGEIMRNVFLASAGEGGTELRSFGELFSLLLDEKSRLNFQNTVFVDAVYGTGFNPERGLDEECSSLFRQINKLREKCGGVQVLAVDIASGTDSESGLVCKDALRADITLSFVYPKTGQLSYPAKAYAGEIEIAGLDLSEAVLRKFWKNEKDFCEWLDFKTSKTPEYSEYDGRFLSEDQADPFISDSFPKREKDGHKGTFGRALAICGSFGMAGAALLAAKSAMQSGAGLLSCLVPEYIYEPLLREIPSAVWIPMTKDFLESDELRRLMNKQDAVLYGPGTGKLKSEDKAIILKALSKASCPVIIDADGLNDLPSGWENLFTAEQKKRLIFTPHPGEFSRLAPEFSGIKSRIEQARSFAVKKGLTLVLKGAATVTASPYGKVYINGSGNSGMGKSGSGDVLAGILLALMARKRGEQKDISRIAAEGVYFHGLCGDFAARKYGEASISAERQIEAAAELLSENERLGNLKRGSC